MADERDFQVIARAGQATLIIVLMTIFMLTVGLWTVYEEAGVVPVGWMWFIAYLAVVLATITHSLAVLVLERSAGGHG